VCAMVEQQVGSSAPKDWQCRSTVCLCQGTVLSLSALAVTPELPLDGALFEIKKKHAGNVAVWNRLDVVADCRRRCPWREIVVVGCSETRPRLLGLLGHARRPSSRREPVRSRPVRGEALSVSGGGRPLCREPTNQNRSAMMPVVRYASCPATKCRQQRRRHGLVSRIQRTRCEC
jgi:hypothetical protein